MGVVTAIVTAAAAVYSAVQQRKASKAQQRSLRAQQRQAEIQNTRERRAQIRQGRVQAASIEAQAANTGLFGSAAAAGATANVQSRVGENLSFLDQMGELAQAASIANQQAAGYASKAQLGEAIGQIASSIGGMYGGSQIKGN